MFKTAAILSTILTIFTYTLKVGKESFPVTYDVTKEADGETMIQMLKEQKSTFKMDSQHRTTLYKLQSAKDKVDVTIELKDGVYYINGTFKGKAVNKTVKSEGNPWYQPIGYVLGSVMDGKKSIKYECFNPLDLEFHPMVAKNDGEEVYDGTRSVKVKINAAGGLASLWHCFYFYDPQTLLQTGYRAVEGGPGTPTTTWTVAK